MGIKEINKLGKAINEIGEKCSLDIISLLESIPKSVNIIKFKKSDEEFMNFKEHECHISLYLEILKRKDQAWNEVIKFLEGLAVKEQKKKGIAK